MGHKLVKIGRFTGVELEIAAFASYEDSANAMLLMSALATDKAAFMYVVVSS